MQEYFVNSTRDKKLEFAFSNSIYDDSSSTSTPRNTPNTRGGIGTISIYFYKGRPIPRRNTTIPQNYNQGCGYADMVKDGEPIAVLHLHYRPASWFAVRGVQVQKPPSYNFPRLPFNGVNQINNITQSNSKPKDNNIKNEIKNEIGIKKENNRNNKRPFDENNEIDVIDLTGDVESVGNVETVEKRARVMDWLSKI